VPLLESMCVRAGRLEPRHRFVVEPKFDGWRGLIYNDGGVD
jgi:hypothetical protein